MKVSMIKALVLMGVIAFTGVAQAAESGSSQTYENQPITVYKSPSCGCCARWVQYMENNGFTVKTVETDKIDQIKAQVGVPDADKSCHTAMVGDYFVEGHVPAEIVKSLLQAKPDIRGISAPGMPMGSPGMEMPNGQSQSYPVTVIGLDGSSRVLTEVN